MWLYWIYWTRLFSKDSWCWIRCLFVWIDYLHTFSDHTRTDFKTLLIFFRIPSPMIFKIGRILQSGSAMSVELQCYLVSPHRHVFDEPGISKKLIHASMEFVIWDCNIVMPMKNKEPQIRSHFSLVTSRQARSYFKFLKGCMGGFRTEMVISTTQIG